MSSEARYYGQPAPWPYIRPEYLTLLVQPCSDQYKSHEATTPTLIKVCRDFRGHSISALLDIRGTTDDRVTVLGPAADVRSRYGDQEVLRLTWVPDQAPRLEAISSFIACIHYDIPESTFPLSDSCVAFARAILEAINITFNRGIDDNQPAFLSPDIWVFCHIPGGTLREYMRTKLFATRMKILQKEEGRVEEVQRCRFRRDSCLPIIVPFGLANPQQVAESLMAVYKHFR